MAQIEIGTQDPRAAIHRRVLFGSILTLLAQFILGMAINLFITISRHHPGSRASDFFSGAFRSVIWRACAAAVCATPPAASLQFPDPPSQLGKLTDPALHSPEGSAPFIESSAA